MKKFRLNHYRDNEDLREVFHAAGWQETDGDDWSVLWRDVEPSNTDLEQLRPGQRVNRLPGMKAICYKDELARNLRAMRENHHSQGENPFDFWPRTYIFPEDFQLFQARLKAEPNARWLRKPADRSQGRGIDWAHLENQSGEAGWVAQEYVSPCLADGRKFILRFYLLINDLEAMDLRASRTPQVKLCRKPYSPPDHDADLAGHLTNYRFHGAEEEADAAELSWSWDTFVLRFGGESETFGRILERCHSILHRMVIAGRKEILRKIPRGAEKCFELLGVDIALDGDLNPKLLECNYSPALFWTPQTAETKEFISNILQDSMSVVTGETPVHGVLVRLKDTLPDPLPCKPSGNVTCRDIDGELSLHCSNTGMTYALNPTAALLWTGIEDGLSIDEMAGELSRATGVAVEKIRADFEKQLGDWYLYGLVTTTEDSTLQLRADFTLLGRSFSLSGPADLVEQIRGQLPTSCGGDAPREHLRVKFCDDYVLLQHGPERLRCLDRSRLLSLLRAHLMLRAIESGADDDLGAMHAASFETDGGLLLLAGPSGSGKSTLSTALLAYGHTCHGDDLCLLRRDLLVQPVPTPIALRKGGREALPEGLSGVLEKGCEGNCLEGQPLVFLPCQPAGAQPLRAIVLASYTPESDILEELPLGTALRLVLKDVLQSRWRTDSDIDRIFELLKGKAYRMEFSSPGSAKRMLEDAKLLVPAVENHSCRG
jgi:hypothetical protein